MKSVIFAAALCGSLIACGPEGRHYVPAADDYVPCCAPRVQRDHAVKEDTRDDATKIFEQIDGRASGGGNGN